MYVCNSMIRRWWKRRQEYEERSVDSLKLKTDLLFFYRLMNYKSRLSYLITSYKSSLSLLYSSQLFSETVSVVFSPE